MNRLDNFNAISLNRGAMERILGGMDKNPKSGCCGSGSGWKDATRDGLVYKGIELACQGLGMAYEAAKESYNNLSEEDKRQMHELNEAAREHRRRI